MFLGEISIADRLWNPFCPSGVPVETRYCLEIKKLCERLLSCLEIGKLGEKLLFCWETGKLGETILFCLQAWTGSCLGCSQVSRREATTTKEPADYSRRSPRPWAPRSSTRRCGSAWRPTPPSGCQPSPLSWRTVPREEELVRDLTLTFLGPTMMSCVERSALHWGTRAPLCKELL